jgi:hypothetical protein
VTGHRVFKKRLDQVLLQRDTVTEQSLCCPLKLRGDSCLRAPTSIEGGLSGGTGLRAPAQECSLKADLPLEDQTGGTGLRAPAHLFSFLSSEVESVTAGQSGGTGMRAPAHCSLSGAINTLTSSVSESVTIGQ